jgi:hypothetical protein
VISLTRRFPARGCTTSVYIPPIIATPGDAFRRVGSVWPGSQQVTHRVHVVNEPGSEKVADDGGAAADAYVLAVCCLAGGLERLGGRGVNEVERRAAPISIDGR